MTAVTNERACVQCWNTGEKHEELVVNRQVPCFDDGAATTTGL